MKQYWVITRPKRKLILIPDLLRIFSAVAEGHSWNRNRDVQIKFEQALTDAQWKAQNNSADGSGGRTYAALLFMLGLWYETPKKGVQLTLASQEILEGNAPVPIITKQLLNYQYPSTYSIKRNVNVSKEFKIWPYRFILNLLLNENLKKITQDEIAYCLVPFAKKMSDIELCKKLIFEYRENPEILIQKAIVSSGTTKDNLRNIANTVINQFEYTGFFQEEYDRKSLALKSEKIEGINTLLEGLRTTFLQNPEDSILFQSRYGSGLNRTKDYSRSIRVPMKIKPNERKILTEFYVISARKPVFSISDSIIEEISYQTGATKSLVQKVLGTLPTKNTSEQFYDAFLQLSVGGRNAAEDFERKTTTLYQRGFNFNADWVGRKRRYPDILIYFDKNRKKHGLIDTKAYTEYNLPLNHKNLMAHTYIPQLKEIEFEDNTYHLAFFGYVSGGFSSTMKKSFTELLSMTDTPGHYITAKNLLALLEYSFEKPLYSENYIDVFSSNQEIVPAKF